MIIFEDINKIKSSFRDPAGFVFYYNNEIYRQINKSYKKNFDFFINSGLFNELVKNKLIIPHEEIAFIRKCEEAYKIIKPEKIKFISYPYEWCFSQLKDAALATLRIFKLALEKNIILKDASAYNIQFHNGSPLLIDTLSFEEYKKNEPWTAYKQFCQHFLAPLLLSLKKDARMLQLSRLFIDGVPIDLASTLLPIKTYFNFSTLTHLHLHSKTLRYYENKEIKKINKKINKKSLLALIDNIETAINNLNWNNKKSEWGEYYTFTNYSDDAFKEKTNIVYDFINYSKPKCIWDIGANTGLFSRLVGKKEIDIIAFDIDYNALEKNYSECKKNNEKNILPLFLDLSNPSPPIGWGNEERTSLFMRKNADTVMALAMIHHITVANNVPFENSAELFKNLCKKLIIEFIPKEDSMVKKLLASRKDIFNKYNIENFEKAYAKYFKIIKSAKIKNSYRKIYLMEKL